MKELIQQRDNNYNNNYNNHHHDNQNINKCQSKYALNALMYKSIKLQQRNYCSNICQILTPLVCIAFTLVTQLISNEIVTGKINSFDFPQPLDMPYFHTMTSSLNLSCYQHYVYNVQGVGAVAGGGGYQYTENQKKNVKNAQRLINNTLKYYCEESQKLMPQFTKVQSPNKYLMDQLRIADKEAFERGNDLKTDLPDGKITFKQVSTNKLNVTYGINDWRLPEYHKNNGVTKIVLKSKGYQQLMSYLRVTEGLMALLQKINRAYLQFSNPKQIIMGSIMYMPFDGQDKSLKNKIINIIGAGLYPLGLSLLLPLFLYNIVTEKEQRLIQIMKMNGLKVKYYWVNVFIFNFAISLVTLGLFYGFGRYFLQLTMFVETSSGVFWALLLGWAIAQIAMTNFVQVFINSAKSATIVGYLLSVFSCLVGEAVTTFIYTYPQKVPLGILLYPPFALCRGIYLIGFNCASNSSCYKGLGQTQPEFNLILLILYGWFFVYLFSIWLNQVVQQQYGVARCPGSVQKCLNRLNRRKQPEQSIMQVFSDQIEYGQIQLSQSTQLVIQDPIQKKPHIDDSVRSQQNRILNMEIGRKPMIIKQLSKRYANPSGQDSNYVALKPLTLNLEEKEIFGLLGPNGAGKTTMISVLTGMYPQTSGNAWINGLEVGSPQTNKYIGVCPQFDLLWPDLTVYEHLKFYSKLKMISSEDIQKQIDDLLLDVDLRQWSSTPSHQLSGGMQRRLSLAIALVGNPRVVFLDEPSSGLDPSHRRQMWNILLKCKKRTSILLTTHLMQEAQVLCDRVGVINKGQLRCIGSISDLKQKFGKGYRLTISYSTNLREAVHRRKISNKPSIQEIELIKRTQQQQQQSQSNQQPRFNQQPQQEQEQEQQNETDIKLKSRQSLISSASASVSISSNISINSSNTTSFDYLKIRPQIIEIIMQKYKTQIVNELNTRIVLKIDKNDILSCINDLKSISQVHWLVSQPSLYDVFVYFVR